MYLTKEIKENIFEKHGKGKTIPDQQKDKLHCSRTESII